ncbi:MAG: diiron oxygenase [Deltaproteobacteria bacterium]|nr:diiron oxygenase [Deltaproteobacteria bacterium]
MDPRLVRALGGGLALLGVTLAARGLPGGPLLGWIGLGILASSPDRARAVALPARLSAVLLFGLALDLLLIGHGAGIESVVQHLGAEDGVQVRMLRLARVASVAIPLMAWLHLGLALSLGRGRGLERGLGLAASREERGRAERWGAIAFGIGAAGLPLVLCLAATVSLWAKWVLFVPADATIIGVACAVILARREGRRLEAISFIAIAASMGVGLVMGGYAFDGPLPEPAFLGAYHDDGRVIARSLHVVTIVFGLLGIVASRVLRPAERPARADPEQDLALDRLNQLSVERSFTPARDLDWRPEAMTTDAELEALYQAWSLLAGTGADAALDTKGRIAFAKYQQMNLMFFTSLLERHGLSAVMSAYDLDDSPRFTEYVGHFVKEETYHHVMFMRAIAAIRATMPDLPPLPMRVLDRTFRVVFAALSLVPHQRFRLALSFTLFRWAERVTMDAHQVASRAIPRPESLIPQVWRYHAIDEARHIRFDGMMIERCSGSPLAARAVTLIVAAIALTMSFLLNANEIWAARQLGLPLHVFHLPGLMRRTQAPFKRKVFARLTEELLGGRSAREEPVEA